MNLGGLVTPLGGGFSARFLAVSYLPTAAAAAFPLALVWAGAPESPPRWNDAWATAANLGLGEVVALGLGLTLAAMLTMPLQLALVRFLEGYWPAAWSPLSRLCRASQRARRRRIAAAARLPDTTTQPSAAEVQAAGLAGTRLKRLFPPEQHLRPTALGNALAAAEHRAGAPYGWDAVVAWPRLYPLLRDQVRVVVDDRRDTLDATARLAVMGALSTIGSVLLLLRGGPWLCLALAPAAVSWLAYLGAIRTAVAYGEAIDIAFDLDRFTLITALHLSLPTDNAAERALAEELCLSWRQGVTEIRTYHHPQ
jgi:hypothetical protein